MSETTLTKVQRYGVVTIPKTIRETLGIQEGDTVRIAVEKIEKTAKVPA